MMMMIYYKWYLFSNISRKSLYRNIDVILICYSISDRSSFHNTRNKWTSEVQRYCPNKPYLLVGTGSNLRNGASERNDNLLIDKPDCVTINEGREMAREIKAVAYMECSVETNDGVKEVFERAALAAITEEQPEESSCKERDCTIL